VPIVEPEKRVFVWPHTTARYAAAGGPAAARLLRLAQVALLLGLIAGTAPARAASPKPDAAPVKSPPKTTRTYTPPATTPPAATYTPPAATHTPVATTKSPAQAAKASSRARKKVKPKQKQKEKKPTAAAVLAAAATITIPTPPVSETAIARPIKAAATTPSTSKSSAAVVDPKPAAHSRGSSGLRSAISIMLSAVMVLLVAAGLLLLVLASLDPYYLRPWRLRRTIENHRLDVVMGGLLLLVSMSVVYFISRSSGL